MPLGKGVTLGEIEHIGSSALQFHYAGGHEKFRPSESEAEHHQRVNDILTGHPPKDTQFIKYRVEVKGLANEIGKSFAYAGSELKRQELKLKAGQTFMAQGEKYVKMGQQAKADAVFKKAAALGYSYKVATEKGWTGPGTGKPAGPPFYVAPAAATAPVAPAAATAPVAPAAATAPAPVVPAELKKAQLSTELKLNSIPVAIKPKSTAGIEAAGPLLAAFNAKYAGKALTEIAALNAKAADYQKLLGELKPIKEQENAAQHQANLKAEAALNEAKAEATAKNKEYMAALGITEEQAAGFTALVKMIGKSDKLLIAQFQKAEQQAKKFNYPISGFEYALLRNYIDGGYYTINPALRSGVLSPEMHIYTQLLNRAIDKMPKYTGEVKRGADLTDKQLAQYLQPGQIVEERSFTSTGIGFKFGGNVRYTIHAIGRRGADLSGGLNPNEKEVLFKAHTFFKANSVKASPTGSYPNTTDIDMTEVEGHE